MASVMRFDEWQDSNGVTVYDGANGPIGGFNASATITASDATWAVPTLGSPIVKVTAIGGGGAGGGGSSGIGIVANSGGDTIFNAGAAGTATASGGAGGRGGYGLNGPGAAGVPGLRSFNGGFGGGYTSGNDTGYNGEVGRPGQVIVSYFDLTGISTVNVTIGAGGSSPMASTADGGAGARGEVIVEYVAG